MRDYLALEAVLLLLLSRCREAVVVVVVAAAGSAADTSRSKRPGRSHLPLLEDAEPDAVAVPVPNRRGADVTIAAVAAAAGNPYKNTSYIPITFSI